MLEEIERYHDSDNDLLTETNSTHTWSSTGAGTLTSVGPVIRVATRWVDMNTT